MQRDFWHRGRFSKAGKAQVEKGLRAGQPRAKQGPCAAAGRCGRGRPEKQEGGNNPIAGLFSGRHAENLAPMWQAGEYARMSSYFYVNDLDIYGQEDEMLVPYAQCVEIYALRQDFFGDWYDAVEKGDIDAWGMAYAAQQMLSMQAETGILPGNEEQYALACGEISAFLEAQAGVSTGQLAALSSGDYTTASNARDEVETLLNLAMADAFRQEGAGGEEGGGAE